jgi:hypothetical protein
MTSINVKAFSALVVSCVVTCYGETNGPPKRNTAKPATSSAIRCPESKAQIACQSFWELVQAKDKSLPNNGYACFRRGADEFFVVSFDRPYFAKHWDDKGIEGYGNVQSYQDGVLTSEVMQTLVFWGIWTPNGAAFLSEGIQVAYKLGEQHNPPEYVSIDDTQFTLSLKYQNGADKTILYSLTIQRSTGRFTEAYSDKSEGASFLENSGRCTYFDLANK